MPNFGLGVLSPGDPRIAVSPTWNTPQPIDARIRRDRGIARRARPCTRCSRATPRADGFVEHGLYTAVEFLALGVWIARVIDRREDRLARSLITAPGRRAARRRAPVAADARRHPLPGRRPLNRHTRLP
jgi:hypothetical protein